MFGIEGMSIVMRVFWDKVRSFHSVGVIIIMRDFSNGIFSIHSVRVIQCYRVQI